MKQNITNKFTTHLKNTLDKTGKLALELKNKYINPEHLIFGLSQTKGGIAFDILNKAGLKPETLKEIVRERNEPEEDEDNLTIDDLKFSLPAKKALEKAVLVASQYKHKYVGTEHLLYGLLEIQDPTLEKIFKDYNLSSQDTKKHLTVVLKSTSRFPDLTDFFEGEEFSEGKIGSKTKTPALDFFANDLTNPDQQKKIDPVIGRKKEIERLIHILSRRTKNNPVLIGDPGVGKTAIVEGLAKKIAEGSVPDILRNKRLLSLDLGLVVAGTIYRGEFESRMKQVIEEIKNNPNIILFIDELHNIIGTGSASGSMDAANILKPALSKGLIHCIGATTPEEYKKHIESDAALERRFQPIMVEESTQEETIEILHGIKDNYEKYHRVGISEEAILSAVNLGSRHIQDKYLPDKAIDLIDEAASKIKVNKKPSPLSIQIKNLEEEIKKVEKSKQEAVTQEDFDKAMKFKEQEIDLRQKLIQLQKKEAKQLEGLIGQITKKDIAETISRITGVPLADLVKEEKERLLNLEKFLGQKIIGQDEAIKTISDFIRRSRVGLSNPNRPIGSFIFLGPSGVGKTETAKVLAKTVFEDEKALIRVDMSEFAEGFNISKLIGSPAGYVGYKDTTKLTDQVKRKPYSVVLFDEIEKAHPEVFNLFLQVLEDGHLTDAVGKKINFKNTIIIMTSNVGLSDLNKVAAMGFRTKDEKDQIKLDEKYEEIKKHVLQELQKQFRPEFLNRVDKIVVFRPLNLGNIEKIVELQIDELRERLEKQKIKIELTQKAEKEIAKKSFSPDQGARAVRKIIQEEVENPLAQKLLDGNIKSEDKVKIDFKNAQIILQKEK
jgi:ATP-dependent Clp protease ATP-binding subunit ClpC